MRLSQAIRVGSKLTRQAWGQIKAVDGSTCALGAAAEGLEIDLSSATCWTSVVCRKLEALYPQFNPLIFNAIYILNDIEHWKREAIADWVEVVEKLMERKAFIQAQMNEKKHVNA